MDGLEIQVPKGGTLRMENAAGSSLQVTDGCFWVTQEKEGADHVLEAGGTLRLDRTGVAVISALRPGKVRVAGAGIAALLQ